MQKKCKYCGKEFDATKSKRLYCSDTGRRETTHGYREKCSFTIGLHLMKRATVCSRYLIPVQISSGRFQT